MQAVLPNAVLSIMFEQVMYMQYASVLLVTAVISGVVSRSRYAVYKRYALLLPLSILTLS